MFQNNNIDNGRRFESFVMLIMWFFSVEYCFFSVLFGVLFGPFLSFLVLFGSFWSFSVIKQPALNSLCKMFFLHKPIGQVTEINPEARKKSNKPQFFISTFG